jgi:hypothetical protein
VESTLHREFKRIYADSDGQTEVRVGRFRVDVIRDGRLIEIQHASLAGIRDKVRQLLNAYDVTVVKPVVRRKYLIKLADDRRTIVQRRWSPKFGSVLELFRELVYFTSIFPHRRLRLEVPLIDVEEWREPASKRRRRRQSEFRVRDQRLLHIIDTTTLSSRTDLIPLLKVSLPARFHSGDLAKLLSIKGWQATRIAYCLRQCGAIEAVGKVGNARLYRQCQPAGRHRPDGDGNSFRTQGKTIG